MRARARPEFNEGGAIHSGAARGERSEFGAACRRDCGMKKGELVKAVVTGSGTELSAKDVEKVLDAAFREMGQAVCRDSRFAWPGFGTFTVKERKARQGRNPGTGEVMKIAASRTVGFKPAPSLKGSL